MRLQRYKNAVEEAKELPTSMIQSGCFITQYNPQRCYIQFILQIARLDEKLTHGEFVELLREAEKERKEVGKNG
jgi:hypothetical protein